MSHKVTVIVPVFNAASHIERCMNSLLMQTLSGVEVLFVDDHGTDGCVEIIKEYISTHQLEADWQILSTPYNQGPGVARNVGLTKARGEFVAFCDADDWVDNSMYEQLYEIGVNQMADVVACDAMMHHGNQSRRLSNPQYKSRSYYLTHYVAYLWTYLFRRSFLEAQRLCFPSVRSSEDSCFIGQVVLTTNCVARIDAALYHYEIYPDSISHRKHVLRFKEKHQSFSKLIQFAKERGFWRIYKTELLFVYFKKAIVTSFFDFVKSYI